jgi:hypothetical protein
MKALFTRFGMKRKIRVIQFMVNITLYSSSFRFLKHLTPF